MSAESPISDVLIVGSGPSGVNAALEATRRGASVTMIDIGETIDSAVANIPDQSFSQLRRTDTGQGRYFLGDPAQALADLSRAGAHLTPPRRYMIRDMEKLLPIVSENFQPLQATAAGGLGVSWGTNVYTLEDFELEKVGIDPAALRPYYESAANDVGVSGPLKADPFGDFIANIPRQPPLPLDSNASAILSRYQRSASEYERLGFHLGQTSLALLSENLGSRSANKCHDMDFYSDTGFSAYRPQATLEELKKLQNFRYIPRQVAICFADNADRANLTVRHVDDGSTQTFSARRLLLAAGAINTGRLVLTSLPEQGSRLPLLCNPNHWVAAINLSMLGRPAIDRRYSLAQLCGLQRLPNSRDYALAQFYSYRSLLYFRVLGGLPLPPKLGVLFMRLLATAFTAVNLHFLDESADSKYLELKDGVFSAHYRPTASQAAAIVASEKLILRRLRGLHCIPLAVTRPSAGASIHYAGTVPTSSTEQPLTTAANGRLHSTKNVYIADASTWKFLPAKGLTFTLMANARRITQNALES